MPHNARPMSPVASYQPGHFPHEAYYSQQQYATIDKANRYRKGHGGNKNGGGSKRSSSKDSKSKQVSSDSNAEDSTIQRDVDVVKDALDGLLQRGLEERTGIFT